MSSRQQTPPTPLPPPLPSPPPPPPFHECLALALEGPWRALGAPASSSRRLLVPYRDPHSRPQSTPRHCRSEIRRPASSTRHVQIHWRSLGHRRSEHPRLEYLRALLARNGQTTL